MAVATVLRRPAFNSGYFGTINLYLVSTTGVTPGIPLTVAGDLIVMTLHERPNNAWKCEVVGTPPGSGRLLLDIGDTVTG